MDTDAMIDARGATIVREALRSRFGLLALVLLVAIILPTILPHTRFLSVLFTALTTTVLLSGLYAVATSRKHFLIGVALIIPAIMTDWGSEVIDSHVMQAVGVGFSVLFLAYVGWLLLLYILVARRVTTSIIFAAVSLYLLIGFVCAALYYAIELFQGDPMISTTFAGNIGMAPPRAETLYYSFVTLTTLGFGDISPVAQPTRALSIVEALIGQLFLVTMMARLVSLQVAHSGDAKPSEV